MRAQLNQRSFGLILIRMTPLPIQHVAYTIELTLILPVATVSVERIFSAMKIIKTDLRNKVSDE